MPKREGIRDGSATRSRETLASQLNTAADARELNNEQLKQSARGVIQMQLQGLLTSREAMWKLDLISSEAAHRAHD